MYLCSRLEKRGVAQLVAFLVWDQAVAGSSPVAPTKVETIVLNFSTIVFYSSFFSNHPRLWKVRESRRWLYFPKKNTVTG